MNTPNIKQHIKSLQGQVDQIVDPNLKFAFMPDIASPKIYFGISVIILIILVVLKPSFLKYKDEKGNLKISYKKLFISYVVLTLIAFSILFVYNRTNKTK